MCRRFTRGRRPFRSRRGSPQSAIETTPCFTVRRQAFDLGKSCANGESAGLAAADPNGAKVKVLKWISASGASHPRIPRQNVSRGIYVSGTPVKLATENGVVVSYDRVVIQIPLLGDGVEAAVLDSTAPALSLCRLIMDGFQVK